MHDPDTLESELQSLFNVRQGVLDLDHQHLGKMPRLFNKFYDRLKTDTTIRLLKLQCNDLGDKEATCLARVLAFNRTLEKLDLANNNIGYKGVYEITSALAWNANNRLSSLSLSHNPIKDEGVAKLVLFLPHLFFLRHLYLASTQISVEAVQHISNHLATPTCALSKLDLGQNALEDNAAIVLSQGLEENQFLRSLKLKGNPISNFGAAFIVCARMKNQYSRLRSLDLSFTHITDAEILSPIVQNPCLSFLCLDGAPLYKTAEILASDLEENASLTVLSLSMVGMEDSAANAIFAALSRQSTLKKLTLSDNDLSDDIMPSVVAYLQTSSTLRVLNLQKNRLTDKIGVRVASKLYNISTLEKLEMSQQKPALSKDGQKTLAEINLALQRNRNRRYAERKEREEALQALREMSFTTTATGLITTPNGFTPPSEEPVITPSRTATEAEVKQAQEASSTLPGFKRASKIATNRFNNLRITVPQSNKLPHKPM